MTDEEEKVKYPLIDSTPNPYIDLSVENYADNEVACKLAKKYNEILVRKDKRICGIEVILNIVECNPFIELGKIIPHINDLHNLIRLLTNCEDVELFYTIQILIVAVQEVNSVMLIRNLYSKTEIYYTSKVRLLKSHEF